MSGSPAQRLRAGIVLLCAAEGEGETFSNVFLWRMRRWRRSPKEAGLGGFKPRLIQALSSLI